MEKYWAKIERGEYAYYYDENNFLFKSKINVKLLGFLTDCIFYDNNDNEVLSIRMTNFLLGIKLKILKQSLSSTIILRRKNLNLYCMHVLNKEIYLKVTFISYLMKSFGKYYIDGKVYGKVIRRKKTMMYADFIFNFDEDVNEINHYCMLLFAMHTLGYSNVRYN